MKYHLGCGSIYLEGYCNVDFPPGNHSVNNSVKVDQYANILTMQMNKCSEIRSSHVFEHFSYVNSMVLLYKWYGALELGGILRICLPDVEALSAELSNASVDKSFKIIRYLYGSHEDPWAYHINGWTQKTLSYVLGKIGFRVCSVNQTKAGDSEHPNCSLEIISDKVTDKPDKDVREEILSIFKLYKNGDTGFENSLEEHFKKEFLSKI